MSPQMSIYSLSLCVLILTTILPVAAHKQGELLDDQAVCLIQHDIKLATIGTSDATQQATSESLQTSGLWHEPSLLLEARARSVLHIPYGHIAVDVPYNGLWEEIKTFPQRRPRELNVILATCKTWSADAIVQFGAHRRGNTWAFDWSRSLAFGLFGFLYIGLAQWFLYVTVLTTLFPDAMMFANAPWSAKLQDREGLWDVAGQVTIDNSLFQALIYFPVFYAIKTALQGGLGDLLSDGPSRIKSGMRSYRENFWADNLASLCVWVPADVVIFACPMYMRMPLEHCVSFGWTMFISATRGAKPQDDPKVGESKVEEPMPMPKAG